MSSPSLGRADYYYVGSFDDQILRYGQSHSLALDSINETLMQSALFGGPLLINDGYLMLYPSGQQALTDRTASPLADLIDEGYVSLFSRNGGELSKMPEQMAHIDTYVKLMKSDRWPSLQWRLQELERRLQSRQDAVWPWPKVNLGSGFVRLVNLAVAAYDRNPIFGSPLMPLQLDRFLRSFNDEMQANPKAPARTAWRLQYERPEFGISQEGQSILHWLGIEAYHYNFAMAASIGNNGHTRFPGVITRHSYLFEELNDRSTSDVDEGCAPQEIPTPSVSKAISRHVLRQGKFLCEVIKNGTELNNAKIDYLLAVQNALKDRQALPEAIRAAKSYEMAIRAHAEENYPLEIADWWSRNLDYVNIAVQGSMQTAAFGLLAAHQLDASIIGNLTTNIGAPIIGLVLRELVDKARTHIPDVSVNLVVDLFDGLPEYQHELVDIEEKLQGAHWFALLKIKRALAIEHVQQLPSF